MGAYCTCTMLLYTQACEPHHSLIFGKPQSGQTLLHFIEIRLVISGGHSMVSSLWVGTYTTQHVKYTYVHTYVLHICMIRILTVHMYIHTCTPIGEMHECTCIHTHTDTQTHRQTDTHTHTHTHTHTQTHT